MRKELKKPKAFLGPLVILAMLVSMFSVAVPVMGASPAFTGDVEADFPAGPDFLTFPDPDGQNVLVPAHPAPGTSSGWDIKDVRVTYDSVTDILYVGLNSYQTVGDADTDGNEGGMTYGTGIDVPNLGAGESVSVYFDLNQDGSWDVIAGVPDTADFSGFTVKSAIGAAPGLAFFGATDLTAHLGSVYWSPGTAPDLEFQILDFDGLPNQGGELGAFHIGAFMGSLVDDFIEDSLYGSTSPVINIVKMTNGTDNNSAPGPYIPVGDTVTWTYVVTNPGTVPLSNISVIDDQGVVPVYQSGDDGDNILQTTETWIYEASGTATVGQYSNTGIATGYSDGFPVSDTDPDYYAGVDARISITPSGTNPINTPHDFIVTVEKTDDGSTWSPAVGVTVTPSHSGAGGITSSGPYITDGSGQVTVTVNSAVAGMAYVHASASVPVDGGFINVATDGYGAWIVENQKIWGDARISITPIATNPVNTPHDFIVTVETTDDGSTWLPAVGVTVTPSHSGAGGITSSGPYVTNGSGQVTVTVNSAVAGTATVHASASVPVDGGFINVATDGYGAFVVENQKTWVDARISIEESGTNPVNTPHDFYVTVEMNDGDGWDPAVGVEVTPTHSGVGSITSSGPYITDVSGQVIVTVNSAVAGTATVHASATVNVGGININVATDGYGAYYVSNVKTWTGGGEGCTPGYWKNNADKKGGVSWVPTGYSPSDKFSSVFGVTITVRAGGRKTITDPTLLQALGATGGGVNALARHGVAALLNAAHPGISYDIGDPGDVIDLVHDALVSPDPGAIGAAHTLLAGYNEAGCPINQKGEPE